MKSFVKNWWLLLLLGILLVISGIIIVAYPTPSVLFLTTFFSISFLILGVLEITFSLSNTHAPNWGWYLAGGILDLIIGIILISSSLLTQMGILALFIGFWLLFKGASLIGHSFDVKNMGINSWGWLLALGILEIIIAFIIILFPPVGLAALLIWISISLVFLGVYYIAISLGLRRIKKEIV